MRRENAKRFHSSGRNEAGRLILRYDDPSTGQAREVIYKRKTSPDGGYTVWTADDAPAEISELRAPINVSDRQAQTVLDSWQGTTDALLPVATWTGLLEAHAKTANVKSVAAERVLKKAGRESRWRSLRTGRARLPGRRLLTTKGSQRRHRRSAAKNRAAENRVGQRLPAPRRVAAPRRLSAPQR